MHDRPAVTTYLFTDIEGSTRLWEKDAERMRPALARHDALARIAVESNRGTVVKTLGDGVHAVFDDPLDAVAAALQLQLALVDSETTGGIDLRVRCGLHAGVDERRDNDFFGSVVNRAARIMASGHGGQVLLSHAVALLIGDRLPADIELRDLGAVRLRDLTNPERVYQIVHAKLRQDFPALRSLEATPNNLPQQVSSFIGRERELIKVKTLLVTTRLLTLLGVGGLGKTRLSLQVATDVLSDYPEGVWFVELAALTEGSLVPQAIATSLGVKEEAGRPVIEAVLKYVANRRLLIVLDNCEHLLQACTELSKSLLQSASELKILASSREPLRISGETIYHVPPLSIPGADEDIDLVGLAKHAAVRLFMDRAIAVQASFALAESNAQAVSEICRRLDGIPLAIELAAARVRTLSVHIIAARLSDRFRLLTRGDRAALPRQQTLQALIDWSHELLSERERVVLRRLAVFAGGFTLEAAEAVGATGTVASEDVLDLLTLLVDKSLVVLEPDGRYRLLDTVQEYARAKLRESGDEIQTRSRHLSFYLALAEEVRPRLFGPEQAKWLATLDLERENILSAHIWCDSSEGGAENGLRLVFAIKHYWFNRGLLGLGHRVAVEALTRPGAGVRGIARYCGLFDVGQLCCFMGSYSEAKEYLGEGLSIAREMQDRVRIAMILQPLGMALLGLNDTDGARNHLEEALALAEEMGDQRELAGALNALAQFHRASESLEIAEPLYERVLTIAREMNDRETIAIALLNLAMLSISQQQGSRACAMLREASQIAETIGSKTAGQSVLEVASGLASSREDWERAARYFGVAETLAAKTGLRRDPVDQAFLGPWIACARNAVGQFTFRAAESTGRSLQFEHAISEVRGWLDLLSETI